MGKPPYQHFSWQFSQFDVFGHFKMVAHLDAIATRTTQKQPHIWNWLRTHRIATDTALLQRHTCLMEPGKPGKSFFEARFDVLRRNIFKRKIQVIWTVQFVQTCVVIDYLAALLTGTLSMKSNTFKSALAP